MNNEAMKQALEALEKSVDNFPANTQHRNAIASLRAAIAQAQSTMVDKQSTNLAEQGREWVGLTPEEIDDVYRAIPDPVQHWKLSRAIEAKLREKNAQPEKAEPVGTSDRFVFRANHPHGPNVLDKSTGRWMGVDLVREMASVLPAQPAPQAVAQGWEVQRAQAFVPQGWKPVPVEPTPGMIASAALNVLPEPSAADFELSRLAARLILSDPRCPPSATLEELAAAMATIIPAHRAMLAAAPSAPQPAEGDKP